MNRQIHCAKMIRKALIHILVLTRRPKMKTKTIALCVLMLALANCQNAFANDAISMAIDSSQSNVSLSVAGSADTSTISGPVEMVLGSTSVPFGTAQVTDVQIVLDDGFNISFLGGLVSINAEQNDVVITMQTPGPAGVVDGNNQFSQIGNVATATGLIEVFDPFGLAGGTGTIDLSTSGPLLFDIQNAELSSGGGDINLALSLVLTFEVAAGVEAIIDGNLLATGAIPIPVDVPPSVVDVFRGVLLSGGLTEITNSDDSFMQLNPGFTISPAEAPVWLLFDGILADDCPTSLSFSIESNVNTPGLEVVTELFNFDTSSFEVLAQEAASFNSDSVLTAFASGDVGRFVEPGTGAIEARVGWYRTSFTIVFPWQVNVDQVSWTASN